MSRDLVMIHTSVPDELLAKRIAHLLVEEKLAACIHILPPMLSIYEWQDEIQGEREVALIIKTSQSVAQQTLARLIELHPYDVPQAVVVPIVDGHAPYLDWVRQQTQAPR